jgi:hypothetical protein
MKKFVFPLVVATVKSSAKLVEVRGIVFFFFTERTLHGHGKSEHYICQPIAKTN